MNKLLRILLSLLLIVDLAVAKPRATYLDVNEPSPYAGYLLTEDGLAQLAAELESLPVICETRLQEQSEIINRECQTKLDAFEITNPIIPPVEEQDYTLEVALITSSLLVGVGLGIWIDD